MSRILRALLPVKATAIGQATVRTDAFKRECRKIAASVVGQQLPYAIIEARLRLFTAQTLLATRNRNAEDIEIFVRAHVDEVDAIWRRAIEPLMKTIDRDPAGTIARELGIRLPARPQGLVSGEVLDKPVPGGTYVESSQFEEGVHFEAI